MSDVVILVTGSRDFTSRDAIKQTFERIEACFPGAYIHLIHGMAQGADTIAKEVADAFGWDTSRKHPVTNADWNRYGKGAGHRRNRIMAAKAHNLMTQGWPTYLIAFPNVVDAQAFTKEASPGTYGMVDHVRSAYPEIPIAIYGKYGDRIG